jgi:hypothetical protein
MSLRQDLSTELARLQGLHAQSPVTTTLAGPGGIALHVDFLAVDSIGCSFLQIALDVPVLSGAAFDALKKWAEALSRKITYLLEQIAPLEFDPLAGEVLIRSTPPDTLPDGTQYYEMLLQSHHGGRFVLRRYESVKGQAGRAQVPLATTREVLLKLADDLVDTIPSGTP